MMRDIIILCENTGQHVNNCNLDNYGLIRKVIVIRPRSVLKHGLFIYLFKRYTCMHYNKYHCT